MKILNSLLFTFAFFLFLPISINGQDNGSELENTKISILTCRSGNELYSTFGHTAIRINNPNKQIDYVYNYGLFSFDTPNFYPKFMRGQLPYFLGVNKMNDFLNEYHFDKRSIFEQELMLNNDQKKKIIEFLAENSKPENREYKYDFFFDNCATRVVDAYSLAGNLSYDYVVEKKTFRDLLKENLQNLVWSDFGIDLVIGARADRQTNRRDQMFLPEYVMANLASAKLDSGQLLAKEAHLVLDFESLDESRKRRSTNWPLVLTFAILIATVLLNTLTQKVAKIYNNVFLFFCGVLGIFLLFMWFGTNHAATRDNWNILWLNPLIIIYLFMKHKLKVIITYVLIAMCVIAGFNCLFTFLPQFFNFAFLPIILAQLVILYIGLKKNKKLSAEM